jgi:hypothetical protein
MKAIALAAALVLCACGGVGDRPAAGPDDAATSSPVDPTSPAPSPTPKVLEPREDLVDVAPRPWEKAIPGEDRTLLVTFWGGVEECYGVDRVEVEEVRRRVIVTLYTGRVPGAEVCIEIAELQAVRVTLAEPLGDRTVVDGAPGEL